MKINRLLCFIGFHNPQTHCSGTSVVITKRNGQKTEDTVFVSTTQCTRCYKVIGLDIDSIIAKLDAEEKARG